MPSGVEHFAPHLIPEAEIVYRTVVDSYDVPPDDDDGDSTAAQRKRRWMAAWVSKRKRR